MTAKPSPSVRREESMRRHPAGKGRIEQLIAEAQDRQAMEMANRGRAELEGWAGGPIPEVAQARMDDEAIELANGARDGAGWQHVAVVTIAVIGLYLIVMAATLIGEIVGGWAL